MYMYVYVYTYVHIYTHKIVENLTLRGQWREGQSGYIWLPTSGRLNLSCKQHRSIHSSIYSGDIKNGNLAKFVVGNAPWKPNIQIVYRGDTHVLIAI